MPTNQAVIDMLNELEITDFYSENGVCYNIYVRNNNKTKDFFYYLELENEIDELKRTESSIDICPIAWKYAKRFDGNKFYSE